jgi:hypothetical protein
MIKCLDLMPREMFRVHIVFTKGSNRRTMVYYRTLLQNNTVKNWNVETSAKPIF